MVARDVVLTFGGRLALTAVIIVGDVIVARALGPEGKGAFTLVLALTTPPWAGPVRCQTYEEKALQRLQAVCSDGTRATSTWSPSLQVWQTTVTPPPGQTCQGRLHPHTRQWEGRCR